MSASLLAGVLSGVIGLLVFLVVHHLWIRPIWFIAPVGLLIAALGGLAVGWAFFHIRSGLPSRPWMSVALLGVIVAMLMPGVLLSFAHGPLFDLATAKVPPGTGGRVALHFAVELVLTASLVGGLAGLWSPVIGYSHAVEG